MAVSICGVVELKDYLGNIERVAGEGPLLLLPPIQRHQCVRVSARRRVVSRTASNARQLSFLVRLASICPQPTSVMLPSLSNDMGRETTFKAAYCLVGPLSVPQSGRN